jgi:SNF2 family DNA or RNA helicase
MEATQFDLSVYEISPEDSQAPHPENIRVRLKSHQLALLQKCIDFEREPVKLKNIPELVRRHPSLDEDDKMHTQVGVIGDKVGAGKSFVILALFLQPTEALPKTFRQHSFGRDKLVFHLADTSAVVPTNLLVIPHNLVQQWKEYIELFPALKPAFITNAKTFEPFRKNAGLFAQHNVVVVTASSYNIVANLVRTHNIRVHRVVYDEVDSMNIPNTEEIPSRFHWFVTASYGSLLYPRGFRTYDQRTARCIYHSQGIKNNGFIKNIFLDLYTNLTRSMINVIVLKNNDRFVDDSFFMTDPIYHMVPSKESNAIGVLNGLVDRNVMECLNAGDVRSAIEAIDPRRKHTEDNVIDILLQKYQDDLHNINVQYNSVQQMTYMHEQDKEQRLVRLKDRREAVESKMESIKERVRNSLCPICYENIDNKTVAQCCNNAFCFHCIHVWINLNSSCPMCKARITQKDIFVVEANAAPVTMHAVDEDSDQLSAMHNKIKNLMVILKQRQDNGKFLIFSSYDNTFTKVSMELTKAGIRHSFLKGNKFQIQQKLHQYKTGNLSVLLVNSSNYGSGLNLENTTDVIMFHKCDTEIEKQVIGRAQRSGRRNTLHVWCLLHENEMPVTPLPLIEDDGIIVEST